MKSHSAFYTLPLRDLPTFLRAVIDSGTELIAPVETDLVRFERVSDPKDVHLGRNSYFPVKEYFFRKEETLFTYAGGRIRVPNATAKERVFFGLRRCDLSAIARQDLVFLKGKFVDPHYAVQRQRSILVGYHCNTPPGKWCFCGSMDLEDFYDLMFWRRKRDYLIHVKTDAGGRFLRRYAKFFAPTRHALTEKDRRTPGTDLLKKRNLAALYDHPDWQKGADLCLSCGACTALCPTCFCFAIHEEPSLTRLGTGRLRLPAGRRVRQWSSCMLLSFTRVAGDHVFREKRLERFKHRIFHQLQYFREKHGIDLCTGCGRCIAGCPTRIDFLSLINAMEARKPKRIPLTVERTPSNGNSHETS